MRKYLTYANVMATIAVFLALGGTAVAAKVIIKKSSQLKSGVVTNSKVKKSTLQADRLSSAARSSLQGKDGAPGKSVPTHWAVINGTTGAIIRKSGPEVTAAGNDPGDGVYHVSFSKPVRTTCSWQYTLEGSLGFVVGDNAGPNNNALFLHTTNSAGTATDATEIHVAVFCP